MDCKKILYSCFLVKTNNCWRESENIFFIIAPFSNSKIAFSKFRGVSVGWGANIF